MSVATYSEVNNIIYKLQNLISYNNAVLLDHTLNV